MNNVKISDGTERVLTDARREALELGYDKVGTAHVLLGLLCWDDEAAKALESVEVTQEDIRERIGRCSAEHEEGAATGLSRFDAEVEKAVEDALELALLTGSRRAENMHLLLALLWDEDNTAARILRDLDVDTRSFRRALVMYLRMPTDQAVLESMLRLFEQMRQVAATNSEVIRAKMADLM